MRKKRRNIRPESGREIVEVNSPHSEIRINASMPQIDVASIPDGTYSAKWGSFPVVADLEVVVAGGRIDKINMKKMESGQGYEGLETIDRIISGQKLKVDAVTGATYSSKVIMITTVKALERK